MANVEEVMESHDSNNGFKYLLCFCIFFILGGVLGIILTTKYLEMQDEDGNNLSKNNNTKSIDITNDKDYESTINSLYSINSTSSLFYNSNGISNETITRDQLLDYIYKYLVKENKYTTDVINALYWGSNVCNNDFLVSTGTNSDGSTFSVGGCDVKNITFVEVNNAAKKLFGISNVDNSAEFISNDNVKCVINGEGYMCGSITSTTGITGELTPKFEITKVTKEEDGSIIIYDKGYLVDTRSNIVNSDDGYENYYLHSSDSTAYYYELKSADNLTFKHVFKMDNDRNYYLASNEVVK